MASNRANSQLPLEEFPVSLNKDRLRAILQTEIDKMARLMEEVAKQSDRVQSAADAIGEKMLTRRDE